MIDFIQAIRHDKKEVSDGGKPLQTRFLPWEFHELRRVVAAKTSQSSQSRFSAVVRFELRAKPPPPSTYPPLHKAA